MTYATDLAAVTTHDVRMTLFVDGLPVLFGTHAGLVHPGDTITNNLLGLTSNDGLDPASISIDGEKLDLDMMMVPPGSASASIRIDPAWDRMFMRRGGVEHRLAAQVSETDTTWTLNSTAGLDGGQFLYVNRETVLIDTVDSTTQVTVVRNAYALSAVNRDGQCHSTGAVVSTAPRYLLGRACELRAWLGTDQSTVLRLLFLAGSPEYDLGNGQWALSFSDAMRLLDRRISVGFQGAEFDATEAALHSGGYTDAGNYILYDIPATALREFQPAADNGYVALWDESGNISVEPILEHAGTAPDARPCVPPRTRNPDFAPGVNAGRPFLATKFRRCYVFNDGSPMRLALKVLLSDRGLGSASGTNHATYDTLLGWTSTSASSTRRVSDTDVECRFGAAVPASFVDVDALEQFVDDYVPGFYYVLGLSDDESLLDVLTEVAWALRGNWYVTPEGKLSFRRWSGASSIGGSTVVDRSSWLHGSSLKSVDDESDILHTVTIKCNYKPDGTGDFLGTVNVIDLEARNTYRDVDGRVENSRRSVYTALPGQHFADATVGLPDVQQVNVDVLRTQLRRIYAKRNRGSRKYTLALPWKFSMLKPGDRLAVTSDVHADFAGGTLDGSILEVMGVSLDPKPGSSAPVTVECQDTWPTYRVSPTVKVASASGATLTLATGSRWDDAATAAKPGRWFAPGWRVKLLNYSASPRFSATVDAVVVSVTDTTVTLNGAATFAGGEAIAAGDLLVQDTYPDDTSTSANDAQDLDQRGYVFGADASDHLGSAAPYTYG